MGRPTQRPALTGAKLDCTAVYRHGSESDSNVKHCHPGSKWYKLLQHYPDLEFCKPELTTVSALLSVMGFTAPRPPSPPLTTTGSRGRSRLIVPFLKCLTLCFVSILVLFMVLGSGTGHRRLHTGYRRFQVGALQAISYEAAAFDNAGRTTVNPSLKNVKGCPEGMENHVPCYDAAAGLKAGFTGGRELDRHCDLVKGKLCVVRPPKGYRLPLKWPASDNNVWSDNVKLAARQRSSRMLVEESAIRFPLEESLVEDYVLELENLLSGGNKTFIELGIRLVLDVDTDMAAFSSYLLSKNLLTMTVSGYEQDGGVVQFAQERGLPAMIGSFSSVQFPYPFSAYDMIHCKSCGVQWHQKDGLFLLEVNRLLRPGGYFVWTPSSLNQSSDNILKTLGKLTTSICWNQLAHNDRTIIWQKTTKQRCYSSRRSTIPMCKPEVASVLQPGLSSCITEAPKGRWRTVQQQHMWPNRLMLSARRLSRYGMNNENFNEDVQSWHAKLANYWSLFTPVIFSDHPKRPGDEDPAAPNNVVRNIMDMNAQYGGFNAALLNAGKPVWVMNVVPTTAPNTLTAVYDRGLLGALHDWCEAFPTYPRSYDLLYATSLLSQELKRPKPCGLSKLVLEMDRLLRPEGWILLQDEKQVIETIRSLLVQIRWEARIIEIPGRSDQRLLVGQKNWRK